MNKTTKIILIVASVLILGVGTYVVIRYYKKNKKELNTNKEVEKIKKSSARTFKESLIAVKNLWKPSQKKTQSNFSNFATQTQTLIETNKNMYNDLYTQNILSNAVMMSKIFQ